ncbi:GD15528 [Drosophila simulans]|uniref:Large ribosomal subunit protein eL18 n=1 Tax=Drosophila simulans TaxID=7240 RepID=B4NVZ7_DROSI|nr:GD15528 [Drosophila simulans]
MRASWWCPISPCAPSTSDYTARDRILKAGGEVLNFHQLALQSPTRNNFLLLDDRLSTCTACNHFSKACSVPHSHTPTYLCCVGHNY